MQAGLRSSATDSKENTDIDNFENREEVIRELLKYSMNKEQEIDDLRRRVSHFEVMFIYMYALDSCKNNQGREHRAQT
jgi:hypothetical protein